MGKRKGMLSSGTSMSEREPKCRSCRSVELWKCSTCLRSVFAAWIQICLVERGRSLGSIYNILNEVSVKTGLGKPG